MGEISASLETAAAGMIEKILAYFGSIRIRKAKKINAEIIKLYARAMSRHAMADFGVPPNPNQAAEAEGLLPAGGPLILSAGGSAYFDRVGERFAAARFGRPLLKVLRSGCYLTHDSIGYARAFERIVAQTTLALPEGGLEPALEVWAYVQSRAEAGRALLTMGKRDVGFDAGMPRPERWFRPGGTMTRPQPMPEGHEVVGLNDQHCHLRSPPSSRGTASQPRRLTSRSARTRGWRRASG